MRKAPLFYLALALVFVTTPAKAWYDHTALMSQVQTRLEKEIPAPAEGLTWTRSLPPDRLSSVARYSEIASLLLLQSRASSTLRSLDAHTFRDLIRLGSEDPDHGIDSDLPDSADPSDDRSYMGGTKGQGSQGFRHMFWSGWNWKKPLSTFQIPTRPLGQAPDRIELLANEARDRFRKGDLRWAGRILGWTIHYLQDLSQPFHATEFPSLAMIPMRAILVWPPNQIIPSLLQESIRVTTNYHWTYEGYTRHALLSPDANPFRECFANSSGSFLVANPRELALAVAELSRKRAPETGAAVVGLVGKHLMEPAVSVPLNPAQIDVEDLLKNPARTTARNRLNAVTCESLRTATDATVWITRWVFAR